MKLTENKANKEVEFREVYLEYPSWEKAVTKRGK